MSEFLRRLHYLLNRSRFEAELADDMEFHKEMAAREGRSNFGNALRLREESRDAWGWTWIDRLIQDLRYAARVLLAAPGFTLAAVLMLAIGIGVNVAAFGFFDLLVLKPLPVKDPESLVRFTRQSPQNYAYEMPYPEMAFFREHTRTLSAVLALHAAKLTIEGEEKPVSTHFVDTGYFMELGAGAQVGRLLDSERDGKPDSEAVVVLSGGFWERHFGADPQIVGKSIRLNQKLAVVVGIAQRGFAGLNMDQADLWAPITQEPYFVEGSHLLTDFSATGTVRMWARLRAGQNPRSAEEELRTLAAELRRQRPNDIWEGETLVSRPGGFASSLRMGGSRGTGREPSDPLVPIGGMVVALSILILAVACSNLGSLLLARGVSREREISVRISVGAGSGRLIRQLFTESLLLALLGSAAGLGLGYAVLKGLMALSGAPEWLDPRPDRWVFAFAVGIAFVAAILFGLAPAVHVARQRHRATIMRQILVGAQVAASCVLLIVAGLLVRAVNHATSMNPGFEYRNVIAIDPSLMTHGFTPEKSRAYLDALKGRLEGLPGIESVGMTGTPPLGGRNVMVVSVEEDGKSIQVHLNRVDPQFLRTMGIRLVRGRDLRSGDLTGIVVSQSLARRHWPGEDPIGKPFLSRADANGKQVAYTVVGVSGNERLVSLNDEGAVEMYVLADPADLATMTLMVKTAGPPESLVASVASVSRTVDPGVFPEVRLLKESFQRKMEQAERTALVVGLLSATAQFLACLGIVGVVAYAVSQRTKEIGIRMALGAKPAQLLLVILRQFSRPVVPGLVIGVALAAALSQLLRKQLYGVSHLDPATYVAAVGVFLATAALAVLLPARRALKVDPMRALREE